MQTRVTRSVSSEGIRNEARRLQRPQQWVQGSRSSTELERHRNKRTTGVWCRRGWRPNNRRTRHAVPSAKAKESAIAPRKGLAIGSSLGTWPRESRDPATYEKVRSCQESLDRQTTIVSGRGQEQKRRPIPRNRRLFFLIRSAGNQGWPSSELWPWG